MDNDNNGGLRAHIDHGAETVYGTHDDNNMVMSEKVQSLAGSIYQEFERMIQRYDEDVVKNLMPLLVNVLECLDSAYQSNQEHEVDLELLRDDNEQLVTQYEREKAARKLSEQKLLDTEDLAESENKELASRLESVESIVRMLELKHKNSLEHANRLEEREGETKREYTRLHDRYTELFKTHVDYMERTKLLMSSTHSQISSASERAPADRSRLHPMYRSSGPVSYGFASLETSQMLDTETVCSVGGSSESGGSGPPSLQNELDSVAAAQTMERSAGTDSVRHINQATSPQTDQAPPGGQVTNSGVGAGDASSSGTASEPVTPTHAPMAGHMAGRTTTKNEKRSANTLYQELSFQDNEESEENEVTGSWVHPGEYASSVNDNFFGMGKEVENLIMENNELLATKNALNIVKDDLIVKVDELTGEIEMLRDELNAISTSRSKLRDKLTELEDELKRTREQVNKQSAGSDQEEENNVSLAQRKRFTRVEMARVLMERNQYKERFMELQEAVRWQELIRASRTSDEAPHQKTSFWHKFFGKFQIQQREPPGPLQLQYNAASHHVTPGPHQPTDVRLAIAAAAHNHNHSNRGSPNHNANSQHQITHHHSSSSSSSGGGGGGSGVAGGALVHAKDYSDESVSDRAHQRRQEQYRQVRAHVQKDDGRVHAYGWSLPGTKTNPHGTPKAGGGGGGGGGAGGGQTGERRMPKVPAPVYCSPLAEASPHMKVFCAAGVNLNGGYTRDGGCIVGASVFYSKPAAQITEITSPTADSAASPPSGDALITANLAAALKSSNATELDSLDKQITMAMESSDPDSQLSSYVWICTSTHAASTVTVLDAKNPSVVLDSFPVCQNHLLCICSVQGALETDYAMLENSEVTKAGETLEKPGDGPDDIGKVEFVRVEQRSATVTSTTPSASSTSSASNGDATNKNTTTLPAAAPRVSSAATATCPPNLAPVDDTAVEVLAPADAPSPATVAGSLPASLALNAVVEDIQTAPMSSPLHLKRPPKAATVSGAPSTTSSATTNNNNNSVYSLAFSKPVNPILGSADPLVEPIMSSVGPTMWLGAQNGMLYVHSSVARWRRCLHQVYLPDAVLSILHVESRVICALANGKIAVFRRQMDGQWDLGSYHLVTLGLPRQSIRCLCVVADKIWAAHQNRIYIVDPITLCVVHQLEAHPRKESQIRQMAATGLGVWISIRLDSTLRLYHAHTYEHLQDVDIEPYVSKMLGTGKLGFSYARITALLVSCQRLWIGTGNGVVISVPLNEAMAVAAGAGFSTTNFIPRCCMANAQLSFHGHRDAVKFFVSVPMQQPGDNLLHLGQQRPMMLVMSGGEGYIDFRHGDGDMENSIVLEPNQTIENRGDKSYLIVWQVSQT